MFPPACGSRLVVAFPEDSARIPFHGLLALTGAGAAKLLPGFLLFFLQRSNVGSVMDAGFVVAILAGLGLFTFSRGGP